jgi:UDP-3-O-[3-hydroxymyristoyl] glucosamine N-acyltransferase
MSYVANNDDGYSKRYNERENESEPIHLTKKSKFSLSGKTARLEIDNEFLFAWYRAMIHPTAVIDPKTELDSDVSVGPYALIEGNVRIGSGTDIQGHAVISGQTFIGKK